MEILLAFGMVAFATACYLLCRKQQKSLRQMSFYKKLIESLQDGIVVTSEDKKHIFYANEHAKAWLPQVAFEEMTVFMNEEQFNIPQHIEMDGRWLEFLYSKVTIDEATRCILSIKDITSLVTRQEEVRYLASYDNMTLLPNKKNLELTIGHILDISEQKSALLYVDLDNFKAVNERFGIEAGDYALNKFVRSLHALIDLNSDKETLATVGRLDGDDFIVFINGYPDFSHIMNLADKIIETAREPIQHEERLIALSCCVGIAIGPEHGHTYKELLDHGFVALRQAKYQQRGCFQVYSWQMQDATRTENAIELALKHSLLKKEFHMCYQPICDQTGKLIGAEALVRWSQAGENVIYPDQFIPLCEKSGLILEIDKLTTRLVTQFIKENQQHLIGVPISINVSPVTFMDLKAMKSLEDLISQDDVLCKQLKLEITENLALDNMAYAQYMIESLNRNQIKVQLDDFGSGYSSLSYISRFKFDAVKIDRSITMEYHTDSGYAILQAIYRIGKALELDIIVEGVENEEQKDALMMIGFNRFQGYYFQKPLTEEAFLEHLKAR